MKKVLLLIVASFAFFSAFSVQITQEQADEIVLQRMSQETRNYALYAKENVQTKMTITTSAGEELELNYPCWVYCVSLNTAGKAFSGRYLIVNESNGNLLEVNPESIAEPNDLAEWRTVDKLLKIGEITEIKLGETASNPQYGLSLRVQKISDSRCPKGVICEWPGFVPVQLHLTTKNGQYDFTLEPSSIAFKNDTVIEGIKYQLIDVLPYPVYGETQTKTVKILVNNQSIIPTLIGKGELYGNGKEGIIKQNLVISDKTEWDKLLLAMNSVNSVSNRFTETDIDFSKYQIIAIFDQIQSSGGWTIDITDITECQNEIAVTVENLHKYGVTCVMTQPYHIVKIPVSGKKIVFKDKTVGDFMAKNYYADAQQLYFDEVIKNNKENNKN